MSAIQIRPSGSRSRDPAAAQLLDEARATLPRVRSESVSRTALVNRLRATRASVVVLVAPAGYGKTNAVAQWASRDERPFAWLSLDEDDDGDAVSLCRHLTEALARVEAVDQSILDSLASGRRSPAAALRILMSALSSLARPLVLVLDDVHVLRSRECSHVLAVLAERFPDGSTLVLAGRASPRIPSARLRMAGRLTDVGPTELALSRREIDMLTRRLGVVFEAAELAELAERTEGWAAGVYLSVLPLHQGPPNGEPDARGPTDRILAEYFDFEHLSRLSTDDLRFLTRTSVLEAMCGSLCDALLEAEGSARTLERMERSNQFLVKLDRPGRWYRYHRQFHAVLRAELDRREPELVPALNRLAADWCEANGAPDAAIDYAHAAGDADFLAGLVAQRVLPAWSAGHDTMVETWLGWLDDAAGLERHPAIAVLGAWAHALKGCPAECERWLGLADRSTVEEALPDGSASIRPWIAVVRAAMCREGPEQMRSDAELALRELGPASRWRPTALLLRGAAEVLLGEDDRAEASLADAADVAESMGATPTLIAALAERSRLTANRGDEERAASLAKQARDLVDAHGLQGYARSGIAFAASARGHLRVGDLAAARADLARARALRPRLTHALPWLSGQTSLELARAALAQLDVAEARAWLAHADEIVRRRPDLGVLPLQLRALVAEADKLATAQHEKVFALTAAEVRLLPFLATHLSFREIGEHLNVSRNTVKTQAISVYRKLGVSSRSDAIERAAGLGLVEGA